MSETKVERQSSRSERVALSIFWLSSGLFALNILIGKASILWGWDFFKLGNIGEFLLLFTASISVVATALHKEAAGIDAQEAGQPQNPVGIIESFQGSGRPPSDH